MWSHALNDGMIGAGESTAPQNSNDRRAGKGNSNYDIRHTLTSNFLWELPFGQGSRFLNSGGFAGALLGGWDLSGIWATRTGRMLLITVTRSSKDLLDGNSSNQRPDLVSGVHFTRKRRRWASGSTAPHSRFPPRATWGNLGRNIATGPGVNQWDMALQKTMKVSESPSYLLPGRVLQHLQPAPFRQSRHQHLLVVLRAHHFAHEPRDRDRHGAADPVHAALRFLTDAHARGASTLCGTPLNPPDEPPVSPTDSSQFTATSAGSQHPVSRIKR